MELIDRNRLLKFAAFDERVIAPDEHDADDILSMIKTAPAVDPIHAAGVCYCRECNHYKQAGQECACFRFSFGVPEPPDNFCGHGEPRAGPT